ncbi:MAG: hypothetical protein M3209_14730 [Acidobacteriota bacterium]|nr:hypothetical protein [Acidobacteriota bacterium]
MVATVLFAGIHSLLASRTVKSATVALFGERQRNGLYRPFYNIVAIATFGWLILYGTRLPDRELYRVRGTFARLMRLGQFAAVLYILYGVWQIGFLRFYGISNLMKLLEGHSHILPEPEAQGPILDVDGEMKAAGPFRISRHPLSFGMLPLFWLMPRMTVNLAAFNLITTIYLFVGAIHEERRLLAAYGSAYEGYQRNGADFFVSSVSRLLEPESNRPKETANFNI